VWTIRLHHASFSELRCCSTYTLSLHDALPISSITSSFNSSTDIFISASQSVVIIWVINRKPIDTINKPSAIPRASQRFPFIYVYALAFLRSEEHTSELQSRFDIVCRLLLEKKNTYNLDI